MKSIAITTITILNLTLFISCNHFTKANLHSSTQINFDSNDTIIHGIALVPVAAGGFKKGLYNKSDTLPYNFYIGKFEITNLQFFSYLKQALAEQKIKAGSSAFYGNYPGDSMVPAGQYKLMSYNNRIFFRNNMVLLDSTFANHPVVAVSWYGAISFCSYYGFDLPTEREWEKAARGQTNNWFPWGNNIDSSYANYYNSNDPFEPGTTPIGYYNGQKHDGFATNNAVSPYGCYDMAGNAWEWTKDFWSERVPFHTGKGGGFHYHTPAFLQSYYASCYGPISNPALDLNDVADGFRVVLREK